MHGPSLTSWLLVVVCAVAGGYCLSRARHGTAEQRYRARAQALMGLAMAVMAVPATLVAPPPWLPWGYAAVFTAAAVRAVRLRHAHHAVDALAMVYMALAMTPLLAADPAVSGTAPMTMPGGHGGASAMDHTGHGAMGGPPLVTGALLVYYAGSVLLAGSRLIPDAGAERGETVAVPAGAAPVSPASAGAAATGPGLADGGAALPVDAPGRPAEGSPAGLPEGGAGSRAALADPVLRRAEAFGACRLAMSLGMFVMLLAL
ncbi:DUF5134 domain-containing protein [Streptomyces sp. NPDC002067]